MYEVWEVPDGRGFVYQIKRLDMPFTPSNGWLFLGVSTHHASNRIKFVPSEIFDNPELMLGGYVWDLDHGTVGRWGSPSPRVVHATVFAREFVREK